MLLAQPRLTGEQRATQGMSDYCQPPYVSTSLHIPQPHRRRAMLYTAVHIHRKQSVDAELSHGTDAFPLCSLTFLSRSTVHFCGGRGTRTEGIGSCSQLEISNPALRYRVMNDAKTIPFCFSWTDTSQEEKQREKGLEDGAGEVLRAKQLLIQSCTGEGDNLTSCRCCHGYQSPMCHPRLAPRPCPNILPFNRQRKGTQGDRRFGEYTLELMRHKWDKLVCLRRGEAGGLDMSRPRVGRGKQREQC